MTMINSYASESSNTDAIVINNGNMSIARLNERDADILEGLGNEIIPLAEAGLDTRTANESIAFMEGRRNDAPPLYEDFVTLVSSATTN